MRLSKPFDFDSEQIKVLSGIVSTYYEQTKEKMPVAGAWRSMSDEDLWMHLIRITIAIGKSAPSYRLMASKDSGAAFHRVDEKIPGEARGRRAY